MLSSATGVSACMTTVTIARVAIRSSSTSKWPHFAGSALRGAIGRALRRLVCITSKPVCDGCMVRTNCAYGMTFSPAALDLTLHPSFKNGLPRYVIDAPAIGAHTIKPHDTVSFGVVLLPGHGITEGLLAAVMRQAVSAELFGGGIFSIASLEIATADLSCTPSAIENPAITQYHLRFHSPLRQQQDGEPIRDQRQLTKKIWMQAMRMRYLQWCQITALPIDATVTAALTDSAVIQFDASDMRWHDMARKSQNHSPRIPLGGLLGDLFFCVTAKASPSIDPIIRLCETLHIGKETVMGLGAFKLVSRQKIPAAE